MTVGEILAIIYAGIGGGSLSGFANSYINGERTVVNLANGFVGVCFLGIGLVYLEAESRRRKKEAPA